jgi:selenocysteine lyase/cysteine desulfurase
MPDGQTLTPGGFKAYEHRWAMTEAFELHLRIGKQAVAARTHALARQLKEGLAAMGHVALHTPMSDALSSGIVCFDVNGMSPGECVDRLLENKVVATVTPYATPHVRLAPSVRNTPAEVERALAAVRVLA